MKPMMTILFTAIAFCATMELAGAESRDRGTQARITTLEKRAQQLSAAAGIRSNQPRATTRRRMPRGRASRVPVYQPWIGRAGCVPLLLVLLQGAAVPPQRAAPVATYGAGAALAGRLGAALFPTRRF